MHAAGTGSLVGVEKDADDVPGPTAAVAVAVDGAGAGAGAAAED